MSGRETETERERDRETEKVVRGKEEVAGSLGELSLTMICLPWRMSSGICLRWPEVGFLSSAPCCVSQLTGQLPTSHV